MHTQTAHDSTRALSAQLRAGTRARRLVRGVAHHLFRLGALALASVSFTTVPYRLIGLLNRRGRWLHSVFYCYPGRRAYARHYCYAFAERWLRWLPAPIAVFRQGGRWGLVLASPVCEAEFTDPANTASLCRLLRRIERIARLCGAAEVNHAGILPGELQRRFGRDGADPARAVAVVVDAVERTLADVVGDTGAPVILLGGRGFIGRALHEALRARGGDVHVVDRRDGHTSLPATLRGRACLLLDVAREGTLAGYLEQLWPGLVVLNETFPEPSPQLLHALARRAIPVYHIAGSAAFIWPSLPQGYRACVPCCALHDAAGARALIRRLR